MGIKQFEKIKDIAFVRGGLAIILGLAGIISITGAHSGIGRFSTSLFIGTGTAWLSQHSILVGFIFLYLARKVYQGEVVAYRLALLLSFLQIVKFSIFIPRLLPLLAYSLITIILLLSSKYFSRHSFPSKFISRLRSAVFALLASILVITLFSVVTQIRDTEALEKSGYNAGRIVMRASLLEISSNPKDTFRARIFGQTLTAAGIAMYVWVLSGLFVPAFYAKNHAESAEREAMEDMLDQYSKSSEDSFKLWPEDKKYWFNQGYSAAIAYKQSKGVVIALSAPIGNPHARTRAVISFRDFCRSKGWKLTWLLADDKAMLLYERSGCKSLRIGASAVVNLELYATSTVKNKWWRWIRNKNTKLGYTYETLTQPLSDADKLGLTRVSEEWLLENSHAEKTFAMGYFDISFLNHCTVHVLRDSNNEIVAFANQLPSYNATSQATIDLMRARTDSDGAVAFLLSEILVNLHAQNHYKTFDLGFVPFADNDIARAKKVVLLLMTSLFGAFPGPGLQQFKNKFEPTWHDNYIAWDGDWLDLPQIAQAIDKVLSIEKTDS
jgi:phosphatidylglycerol lysyltransferase